MHCPPMSRFANVALYRHGGLYKFGHSASQNRDGIRSQLAAVVSDEMSGAPARGNDGASCK
jgi:hypothetical protein